jgi:hypothetical protein
MNSEKPKNYSKKMKLLTALKFGKTIYGQVTKNRQKWIGGTAETQYSSVIEIRSEGVKVK